MALPDLLSSLEEDARAEAGALRSAADEEAARLRAAAAHRIRGTRAEARARAEAGARTEVRRRTESARRDATRRLLEARAEVLARVMARAAVRLPDHLADPGVRDALRRALEAALVGVGPDEPVRVAAAPSLLPVLEDAVAGRSGAVMEPDAAVASGFVLRLPGRGVVVDGTLEAALAARRPRLAVEAARALDPEADP